MNKEPHFDPNGAAPADSGIFGLPYTPDEARVVLIPVPWEPTTSYRRGTARGPAAILAASHQVDLFDVETGRPYKSGIAMLDETPEVHAWNEEARALADRIIAVGGDIGGDRALANNLERVNELGERLNAWLRGIADHWLANGRIVGTIGGDHSSPFGAIQAVAARHPGLGILHLDAHADLRVAYEGFTWSHASIMYNVVERIPEVARLVQVGIRDFCEAEHAIIEGSAGRIITHFDAALAARRFDGETWATQCARIVADLPELVYLSFDIDGLDPALCPHTGTPVPGGLGFSEAAFLVKSVVESGRRIVGFDLCEVAPGPDDDEWDANVAARLLYKMIGWALRSQG